MRTWLSRTSVGLVATFWILMFQGEAIADVISDRMVVTDPAGNVLPIIGANGEVLPNGELPEAPEPLDQGTTNARNVMIFGPAPVFGDPRLFASSNLSLALLEPDGTVSDVMFVILTVLEGSNGVMQINFFSDPEQPVFAQVSGGIPETGGLQDVTAALFPGFADPAAAPFRVLVQSDLEAPVPQPAGLLLLIAGAMVLGIGRCRSRILASRSSLRERGH